MLAVVTHKTRYSDNNGKMTTIVFGLGNAITINTIINLSTFKRWESVLNVDANLPTYK